MTEEKMISPNPSKVFMVIGILAVVYGIINYLMAVMDWTPSASWIAGGVILLLVSWAKQSKS